ncbi:MAG: hypothetical protein WCI17_04875 [bacterium]
MKELRVLGSVLMIALVSTCVFAQTPQPAAPVVVPAAVPAGGAAVDPAAVRAEYNAIVSHLDPGGNLMVVANTDGILEDLVEMVRGFAQFVPQGPSAGNSFVQALERLPAFLTSSGLYAVDGFGMSVVPRADGRSDVKTFVYRDPAAAQLPFWQGVVGGAPKRLATLDYLPSDTVMVRAGTADPRQLWKFIGEAVRQVGGPDAARAFDGVLAEAGRSLGTNLSNVIASLDSEQFFSMQLSATQTIELPAAGADGGTEALSIPAPSLLVGCAVRDATLMSVIQQKLRRERVPVIISTNGATTLYTINPPMPMMPVPFAPTFAVHRGMFLFGSTAEVVQNAIATAEKPGGAQLPAGIQKAFEGLPKQNNGIAYVDRRFSDTLAKVQTYFLKQSAGSGGMNGMAMQQLFQRQQPGQIAIVFVNEKDGISMRGTTSQSGRQILLGMTVAPAAVMAAVAIPAFMKVRQVSAASYRTNEQPRQPLCRNNLRLIDHAKQQWALANRKTEADTPTAKDIAIYIKGGMPVCPQGGTYAIKTVGEAPACSRAGHVLAE